MALRKHLIVISTTYPNLDTEPYLYYEFKYLLTYFNSVTFIGHTPLPEAYKLPKNCDFVFVPYLPNSFQKAKALIYLFNPLFWTELPIMSRSKKKDWFVNTNNLLGSIETAYRFKKIISSIVTKQSYRPENTVVYSYWNNNVAVGLSLLKKTMPNVKCISRAHGYDVYLERNPGQYLPLRKLIFSSLDHVLFVSNNGLLYSQKLFGKYLSFAVSYLGVEASLTKKIEEQKKNLQSIRVVSCSSLKLVKRVHLIIEALALSDINIYWEHIGDGPLLSDLKKLASRVLDKNPQVSYSFKGHMNNGEIPNYYKKNEFNVFLNVSSSEGLPVSIMEAFSCYIPVIATNVGGTSEAVEDAINGYLLPEEFRPIQLIQLINELTNNQEYFLSNAERTWSDKFKASINYPLFIKKYLL